MRDLPRVVLTTVAVVVVPVLVAMTLRASAVISSPWLSMVLAGVLSLVASRIGSTYWRKRRGAGDLLFSDLLIWGWLRRWRQDRRLAKAVRSLGLMRADGAAAPESLSAARAQHLLGQLADALESQDAYLRGHSRRVARHAAMIAQGMGLPAEEVERVGTAAVLHDIGKLKTPRPVVNKPGRLTDAEFDLIKLHPVDGAQMAAVLADPRLTAIVRHHHERMDGTGYPDGLSGNDIPVGARIIAVADTFDAVTSNRAYRSAARHTQAIDILRRESGSQLDPVAVRAFMAYYSGNRPAACWAVGCALLRQIIGWFNGEPVAAAPVSSSQFAATVLMTAGIGATAAVAPIAANQSRLRPAGPSVSAHDGDSTTGSAAPRSLRGSRSNDQGRSNPARSPAVDIKRAVTQSGGVGRATGSQLIAAPTRPRQLVDLTRNPRQAVMGTTAGASSATSVVSAPPVTPVVSGSPVPPAAAALPDQASSTASPAAAPNPPAAAPPRPAGHPPPHGHSGPANGPPSASPDSGARGTGHTSAAATSPDTVPPGNAYGKSNGGPGNASTQADQGGPGSGSSPASANGHANGHANANGQSNSPASAGGQGHAYGHSQAGS
ncbi:MAG: HD domain-containing phosphohydrolase [Solirubrobacteraceae bacterium]